MEAFCVRSPTAQSVSGSSGSIRGGETRLALPPCSRGGTSQKPRRFSLKPSKVSGSPLRGPTTLSPTVTHHSLVSAPLSSDSPVVANWIPDSGDSMLTMQEQGRSYDVVLRRRKEHDGLAVPLADETQNWHVRTKNPSHFGAIGVASRGLLRAASADAFGREQPRQRRKSHEKFAAQLQAVCIKSGWQIVPDLSLENAKDGKSGDAAQEAATLEVLLDQAIAAHGQESGQSAAAGRTAMQIQPRVRGTDRLEGRASILLASSLMAKGADTSRSRVEGVGTSDISSAHVSGPNVTRGRRAAQQHMDRKQVLHLYDLYLLNERENQRRVQQTRATENMTLCGLDSSSRVHCYLENAEGFASVLQAYFPTHSKAQITTMMKIVRPQQQWAEQQRWEEHFRNGARRADILRYFGTISNGSVYVSLAKFLDAVSGANVGIGSVKAIFNEFDADKNGRLDMDEFTALLSNHKQLRVHLDKIISDAAKRSTLSWSR